YSLGIMLYRMLTGRLPFLGETMFEYVNQRMKGTYPPPSVVADDVPVEFDALVRELMERDPTDRPRDAFALMQRLLDIGRAAREGTLREKRKVEVEKVDAATAKVTRSRLADASEKSIFGTFTSGVHTLFGTLSGAVLDGKKKKRSTGDEPFYETTGFLVGLLVATALFLGWMFWPLGPDALFAKGKTLMASEAYDDWDRAVRDYFDPLERKYPDSEYKDEIQEFRDKIAVSKAEGRIRYYFKFRLPKEGATEAEAKFLDAVRLEDDFNDPITAQQRYRAIIEVFGEQPAERPWVLLARKRLEKQLVAASDEERRAKKRAAVAAALTRARAAANRSEAVQLYAGIEDLYRGDADVADLVEEARREAGGARPPARNTPKSAP
ncbi:MAG: hypothetical protein ACRC1K_18385, partial [Planctomycetia bacterium]